MVRSTTSSCTIMPCSSRYATACAHASLRPGMVKPICCSSAMNTAVWSALKGNKGGRTVAQVGSSPKCAMACLRAGNHRVLLPEYVTHTIEFGLLHLGCGILPGGIQRMDGGRIDIRRGGNAAVPPWRIFASRKVSLPTNTSKPEVAKASSIAFVLFQFPSCP